MEMTSFNILHLTMTPEASPHSGPKNLLLLEDTQPLMIVQSNLINNCKTYYQYLNSNFSVIYIPYNPKMVFWLKQWT